jgi:hypothetical protein
MAVSLRPPGVPVAVPSPHPGRLADAQGFTYLAESLTGILWPHYEAIVSNWASPVMFGELAIMLWLVIMGANERHRLATAAA